MNKKQKIALTLNVVIFLMAVVGCVLCFNVKSDPLGHAIKVLHYFTLQSNIFAGVISLIYIIFALKKHTSKKFEKVLHILRYIITVNLIITFLVVTLFFGFIAEDGYFSMFENANFFFHFAIPVTNFVSFVFFENVFKLKISHTFFGMIHIGLYGIYYLINCLLHYENGSVPITYDWYYFTQFGIVWAFIIAFVILLIAYLVCFLLCKLKNKIFKNN